MNTSPLRTLMMQNYTPDDFDAKGQLKLPLAFWAVLLLQARTWLLFVMAGASREQGASLLALFYPDTQAFWIGMALGVPAALGLLLTGYRQRFPRIWQAWRWVLCLTLVGIVTLQAIGLSLDDEAASPVVILLTGFDLIALIWLGFSVRIRDCFNPRLNGE